MAQSSESLESGTQFAHNHLASVATISAEAISCYQIALSFGSGGPQSRALANGASRPLHHDGLGGRSWFLALWFGGSHAGV